MYKLMITEDDLGIAEAIKERAEQWGMTVHVAENFRDIIDEFNKFSPDIVLLDIALPFYNGFYWCGEMRKISKVPIIFISSAGDNMNIVTAMDMGADDFIVKPFDMDVLMAKIRAMLRRTYDLSDSTSHLEHRGAVLNTGNHSMTYNGERIELTKNEYRILLCLLENKGRVVSRDRIMERLWETDSFIDANTLSVNMTRLRKKLDARGLKDFITTKFKEGYIIE